MNQEILENPETRVAEQLWPTVRMLQTEDVLIIWRCIFMSSGSVSDTLSSDTGEGF